MDFMYSPVKRPAHTYDPSRMDLRLPLAREAPSGPPIGEEVLATQDVWVRWLALDADTLFFVRTDKVQRGAAWLAADSLYAVALGGDHPSSARQRVPSRVPDEKAWSGILASEARIERLARSTHGASSSSRKRRRIDGSDQPIVIADPFRVEAVCGETVLQGESDGRIQALTVADRTQRTIARSPVRGPALYLFRTSHYLYWQTNGTIYRAPLECDGPNPFPERGEPPEVNRNGVPYMLDEQ
jgi:hypothetical protein